MPVNIRLDLNKRPNTAPIQFIRLSDASVDTIYGTVLQDGEPFDLTGYAIVFEGVASNGNTVSDTHTTIVDAKKGTFKYTFSSSVASVGGRYKNAYFALTKGSTRTSTGNIDLFVWNDISGNKSDVSQEQVDTYNGLVQELMDLNDENMATLNQQTKDFGDKIAAYISGTDSDFKDYDTRIAKLIADTQAKVATMQGPKGDKGDPGTGLMLKGKVTSVGDLPATANAGDGYLVSGNIYVWVDGAWFNGGAFQGPKGDTGATGADGKDGQDGVTPDLTGYSKVIKSSGNSEETAVSDSTAETEGFYYWEEDE